MKSKQIIGFITKTMFYTQSKKITSPELVVYDVPLDKINSWDIERMVYLEDGVVKLENMKDKAFRLRQVFLIEKEENRPIINENTNYNDGDEDDTDNSDTKKSIQKYENETTH